ncbi:UNVERIFIED_CONTAM: hypothetical protein RMT77_002146 [Armadillidium vulgare]
MKLNILLIAIFAIGSQAEIRNGTCANVTPYADLEVAPYLGLWYEERRMYMIWETEQDCNTAIYSDLGNGTVEVHNTGRNAAGEYKDIYGQAVVSAPGTLSVTFPGHSQTAAYIVLYTDYETYSCVFSCDQVTADSQDVFAWILARNVPLSQDTIDAALAVFESNGVDTSLFQEQTYQGDDCPYYNPTI